MPKLSWLPASLFIILALSLSSLSSAELRIGVNPTYKPLIYKEGSKLTGIEVATAKELAKILDEKITFVEMNWDALIPAVQKGEIDAIMSGMSITEARKGLVDFSHSYLEIGQMAIIRSKDAGRLSAPRAIFQSGSKVGVEQGTTGQSFAKDFLISANIKSYENPDQIFAALRSGEVDFFLHDAPTSWKLAQTMEHSDLLALYRPLTKESLAWAVKKGNTALLQRLNNGLKTLKSKGTLSHIQNHWIPVKIAVGE